MLAEIGEREREGRRHAQPLRDRKIVNVVMSGACASSAVGMASRTRLIRIPSWIDLAAEIADCQAENAMPSVLALTAKPMAAGVTP